VKSAAIRLVVVSDVRLYRDGLAQILGGESRLAVVGTASDAEAAVQLALAKTPDVALVDMGMPQSVTAVREMAARAAIVKIVALAVREDEQDLVACAAAGVAAYVTRGASVADLVQALDGVARGELLCSPQTAATLWRRLAALARGVGGSEHANPLTRREREIGTLLEDGLSNKEISARLGIEVATVKNHVHNVLEKLQVHRRAQAAARLKGISSWSGRRATPVA